jgi:hypothetical protein
MTPMVAGVEDAFDVMINFREDIVVGTAAYAREDLKFDGKGSEYEAAIEKFLLEGLDLASVALDCFAFSSLYETPLVNVLPQPARANRFVDVEEVAVEFATEFLADEHLCISTQYFALHGCTPLESAALEVVAEAGQYPLVGLGG